jgi:pimeloyl-ACP methyl ester carboxylesterase
LTDEAANSEDDDHSKDLHTGQVPKHPLAAQTHDPATLVFERDGRTLVALDWGGNGPPLVLLHPNGFCAGIFDPIARRLSNTYRPIAFDLAGHGRSDPPTEYSFRGLAEDVACCLDAIHIDSAYAVGASLGGGTAIFLNALRPQLFGHVLLAEAVAFETEAGAASSNTFIEQARRRRVNWPNRLAMEESYGNRPPLDALNAESLRAYLRWGAIDEYDGTVSLACPPAVEAAFYSIAQTKEGGAGAWDLLPTLKGRATILAGSRSDLSRDRFARQAAVVDAPVTRLDAGHLLLFEDTDRAVSLIADLLSRSPNAMG